MSQFKPWFSKKKHSLKEDKVKHAENKLWEVFSQFIRLRDSDHEGMCKCFTCHRITHWTRMDAGHGVPRQHKATKFNESNNHAQCKHCNGFEGGKREVYKEKMDKRYGAGTWDRMLIASKDTAKYGVTELQAMTAYYRNEVSRLKQEKGML